jgi:hypothetical protein
VFQQIRREQLRPHPSSAHSGAYQPNHNVRASQLLYESGEDHDGIDESKADAYQNPVDENEAEISRLIFVSYDLLLLCPS